MSADIAQSCACSQMLSADVVQSRREQKERHDAFSSALKSLESADQQHRKEAVNTLQKVIDNAVNNPLDPKFRQIKKSAKILAVPGCSDFLIIAGFQNHGDKLVLCADNNVKTKLRQAQRELEAFQKEGGLNEQRRERDAKLAAQRENEKKLHDPYQRPRREEWLEERERIKRLIQDDSELRKERHERNKRQCLG
jgi:hypothetical protein